MRKKIAIIVQRYGRQINGGAEVHARMIAEHLAKKYEVTVLTSCALEYHTWKPELPEGESFEGDIRIIRFTGGERLNKKDEHYLNRKLRGRHMPQKLYRWLGKPSWWFKLFPQAEITTQDQERWLQTQGPFTPGLIEYLRKHETEYTAIVPFTAVYFPAAATVLNFGYKCILAPLMHDEPASYFMVFKKVMASPRWIFFNTAAEQRFSERLFDISRVNKKVVAVGIDPPTSQPPLDLNSRFGINKRYILYIGRIDTFKGCDTLIQYFTNYVKTNNSALQLVLAGKNMMDALPTDSVVLPGFVSDEEKEQLIEGAEAVVTPSVYESLSLALLESFAAKVPVIANGHTEVLRDHIEESGGGWCYYDEAGLWSVLSEIEKDRNLKQVKGEAGFKYVSEKYSWEKVLGAYDEAIFDIEQTSLDRRGDTGQ